MRQDRVRYLTQVALMFASLGDSKAAAETLSEAMTLAVESNSRDVAIVAVAEWMKGDNEAAWQIGAQAVEQAYDPLALDMVLDTFQPLRTAIAAKAAQFVKTIIELEKPFGIKRDDIEEAEMSTMNSGWSGDWIDHTVVEAEMWWWAKDQAAVQAVVDNLDHARASANSSPKIAKALEAINEINKRPQNYPFWK